MSCLCQLNAKFDSRVQTDLEHGTKNEARSSTRARAEQRRQSDCHVM